MQRVLVTVAGTITGIGLVIFFMVVGLPDYLKEVRDKLIRKNSSEP